MHMSQDDESELQRLKCSNAMSRIAEYIRASRCLPPEPRDPLGPAGWCASAGAGAHDAHLVPRAAREAAALGDAAQHVLYRCAHPQPQVPGPSRLPLGYAASARLPSDAEPRV